MGDAQPGLFLGQKSGCGIDDLTPSLRLGHRPGALGSMAKNQAVNFTHGSLSWPGSVLNRNTDFTDKGYSKGY